MLNVAVDIPQNSYAFRACVKLDTAVSIIDEQWLKTPPRVATPL